MNRLTKEQRSHVEAMIDTMRSPTSLTDRLDKMEQSCDQVLEVSATALGCYALDLLDENAALLDILERLHSVQDGCPLHGRNAVWVKAMEDAQAAFDRAGGGA